MANPADVKLLDNPIWNSLATDHASIAVNSASGLARRYPANIGPLTGLHEATPVVFAELASIIPEGDIAALFLDAQPEIPIGWERLREETLVQMICDKVTDAPPIDAPIIPLGPDDFADMVTLASLTEPGPFRAQTASLGGFVGIRVAGRLAAMAGRRLSPTGFTEVSAVCTHPEFRGRGYARALVAQVASGIEQEGRVPFLTSLEANVGAVRVYQQCMVRRRTARESYGREDKSAAMYSAFRWRYLSWP